MKGKIGTSRALVCTSGDTKVQFLGFKRILTLSTGSSTVCDVMVNVGHSGGSLAGKVDSQLFPSRVYLIKLTSLGQHVCFGYVLFQKEAHRRNLQKRGKVWPWKLLHSDQFWDMFLK